MSEKENVFESFLRQTHLTKGMINFLEYYSFSDRIHYDWLVNYILYKDLFNLLACNRKIKKIIVDILIPFFAFPLSILHDWNNEPKFERKRKMIHYMYVDIDDNTMILNTQKNYPSLKEIIFNRNFNETITTNIFSSSLSKITFGTFFNQSITKGVLPSGLLSLEFGNYFNQPIEDAFPNSLTELSFGYYFNQKFDGTLLNNLTKLMFGDCFNQPIKDALPNSLTELSLGLFFDQELDGALPKNLKLLGLNCYAKYWDQFKGKTLVVPTSLAEIYYWNRTKNYKIPIKFDELIHWIFFDSDCNKIKNIIILPDGRIVSNS
jgi:hypothetical protein